MTRSHSERDDAPRAALDEPVWSAETARAVLDATPIAMGIVDDDLRFVECNAAYVRLSGQPRERVIGRTVEAVVPELWPALAPHYARARAGARVVRALVEGPPGSEQYAERRNLYLQPVELAGGPAIVVAIDTERPARERVAEALEARNRMYAMLSRVGRVAVESRSREELFAGLCTVAIEAGGFTCAWVGVRDEAALRCIASDGPARGYVDGLVISLDPSDPRSQGATGRAMRDGGVQVVNDFMAAAANGPWRAAAEEAGLRASAAIPFSERGERIGALSVYAQEPGFFTPELIETLSELGPTVTLALDRFAETAERERGEQRRRSLEAQLRQAAKMEAIGTLAGGVAHDFNNTLTVIRNTCQLLLQDAAADAVRDRVALIDAAAESATTLTGQLLTFGRRRVVRPESLVLDEAVREALGLAQRLIRESVTLKHELRAGDAHVRIDRSELHQVLLNLAANARDAMPSGGSLTIRTSALEVDADRAETRPSLAPGGYVVIEAADTGIGMDAETVSRVFEPFFTTKDIGTGIGLATVFGIVHGAGGDVSVYSEPGLGTTLRLYLPISDEPAEARPAPAPAPRADRLAGTETILVVEDSDLLRPLVARILESAGYTVILAADGIEALERAEEHRDGIDLVLTDVVMPRMNGGDLATELSRRSPGLRVMFTSGYPADTVVRHGIAEARVAFVQKPYVTDELLAQVRAVLDAEVTG